MSRDWPAVQAAYKVKRNLHQSQSDCRNGRHVEPAVMVQVFAVWVGVLSVQVVVSAGTLWSVVQGLVIQGLAVWAPAAGAAWAAVMVERSLVSAVGFQLAVSLSVLLGWAQLRVFVG